MHEDETQPGRETDESFGELRVRRLQTEPDRHRRAVARLRVPAGRP